MNGSTGGAGITLNDSGDTVLDRAASVFSEARLRALGSSKKRWQRARKGGRNRQLEKLPIKDAAGNLLGNVPIHDNIT